MASSSSSSPEFSAASSYPSTYRYKYTDFQDVLDDLSSRFILNLPDEELDSLERMCFQVEQAHWFYEDFIRESNSNFPSLSLKKFSEILFRECPLLERWNVDHDGVFNDFMQYKTRVPVCGAIMLNETWDKVVLVKGWKSSAGWGFPKGKINEDEEPHACAVREVLEETGYNLTGQINPNNVIDVSIREQAVTLFIVPNVPEDYPFETKTRKEISRIDWFRLTDLPTWKRNKTVSGKFYLITPFIGPLKAFINKHKPGHLLRRNGRNKIQRLSQDLHIHEESDSSMVDFHIHTSATGDPNVQESSSQSSSADNGDPQTPSPLYSEPAVHPVQVAQPADSILDTASMDPHIARLLNNLSLSASSASSASTSAAIAAFSDSDTTEKPGSTPAPLPSHSMTCSAREHDQNRSLPAQQTTERPPSVSTTQPTAPFSSSPAPEPFPLHLAGSGQCATSPISPHVSSPPPSSILSSSSILPSTSSKMLHNRSVVPKQPPTRTTDLSPYLSRPSDSVVNGKRLRQLALLESVVDETARRTPVLGQRTSYLSPPSTAPTGSFPSFAPPPLPFPVPPTSTSVPPPSFIPGNLSSVSHHPQATAPPHTIYQTIPYNPAPPPMGVNEAFSLRPQTSQSFRPVHPPFRGGNMRGSSMSQAQLLGVLSNGPSVAMHRPPMLQMGVPFLNAGAFVPGFSGSAPGYFPTLPHGDPARAKVASNANLLNILNSHGGAIPSPPSNHSYMGGPPY